ncbi:MAG: hypothetical protein AAGG46_07105, partial [Planctomycetota bacterium]
MPLPLERPPVDSGDWFPWRVFVEAAGAACSAGTLLLAAAALLLSEGGVALFGLVAAETVASLTLPATASNPDLAPPWLALGGDAGLRGYAVGFCWPLLQPGGGTVACGVVTLWRLAVWTIAGAAITRRTAMTLTHHDASRVNAAVGWSLRTAGPRLALAAALVVATGLLRGAVAMFGVGPTTSAAGAVAAAVSIALALTIAVIGAVLLLTIAVAWPLVTASAGVERPDPFDAFSRGVAYAYQRPLRLVVYLAQGWLVG